MSKHDCLCACDELVMKGLEPHLRFIRHRIDGAAEIADRTEGEHCSHRHGSRIYFIERQPICDLILISVKNRLHIAHEMIDHFSSIPAVTGLDQAVRQFIMGNSNERFNAVFCQFIEYIVIKEKPRLVGFFFHPCRKNPRPVDRHAEDLKAHLRSQRNVFLTSSYAEYYQALLRNVGIYFRHRDIATVAVNTESTEGYLRTALETLYDCNVSGIILIGCDYLSVKDCLSRRFPHVWIDCNDPVEETREICTVESDQFVAGQLAAHEFINIGCTKPIILCGSHPSHRNERRINGFTTVYRDNGLDLSEEQIVKLPEMRPHVTEGKDIIQYLVTKGTEFDGVFAISDGRAIGCYMGLQKMGKRIPQVVKLMAFDGIAEANINVLGITSIQQNVELMTKNACELLLKQIKNEKIEERHILVPAGVLPGQTM